MNNKPAIERQRHAVNKIKSMMRRPAEDFLQIDLTTTEHPEWMTRAYKNNHYVIMIMDDCPTTHGPAIRVMVQAHDNKPIKNHWREMFMVKNSFFGEEATAVEYYPAASEFSNQANIYWMFVYPEGVLPKMIIQENKQSNTTQE